MGDTKRTDKLQEEQGKRKTTTRNVRKKDGNIDDATALTKATLEEEIKDFKAIARHILKHEVKQAKGRWIKMENRSNLRRLNDLGIFGHQPAIKAYCQISQEEKATIMEHILKQKIANNRKAETIFAEYRQRELQRMSLKQTEDSSEQGDNTILLRKARIAFGAPVRWKRNFSKQDSSRNHIEEEAAMNGGEVRYNSRLLACTKCGTEHETKDKQLKIKEGFRAINCIKCGKQQRVHSHKCKCKVVWHHCPLHKVDPPQHLLKKEKEKRDVA